MIKVKNKKVIRNLSEKSFKVNKARNLFAIVAIALTSLLFTTLFTMGIGAGETYNGRPCDRSVEMDMPYLNI